MQLVHDLCPFLGPYFAAPIFVRFAFHLTPIMSQKPVDSKSLMQPSIRLDEHFAVRQVSSLYCITSITHLTPKTRTQSRFEGHRRSPSESRRSKHASKHSPSRIAAALPTVALGRWHMEMVSVIADKYGVLHGQSDGCRPSTRARLHLLPLLHPLLHLRCPHP